MWKTNVESGDKMAEIRKRYVFRGRVQGVGFRYTAKYLARSLQLTGWVQNEWDGTVTMEVQGRETLINKLLTGINNNSFIEIEWIESEDIPLERESAFESR
ncbi:acylphosphatase [Dorea sp. D27]|nr:acylphosphatase [Dorea sp. D27]KMZ55814.1 acylphosphatase [Dorea sp. D27]